MKLKFFVPIIFILSFVIYFVSTEHLFPTVGWPTGDEPYYLLIAHSLVYDHDFELSNNFADQDYRAFYPGDLYPRHEAVTPKAILVSKHALGLPLLIAPAYALDGWHGAAHTLNLFGALLAVNVFLLAREVSGNNRVAAISWAALAFAVPIFTYAELIFPEAPAALLIVYAYRHLRRWNESNRLQKFLTLLCLAYLPWLHARFLFVVAGLLLYLAVIVWDEVGKPQARSQVQKSLRAIKFLLPPVLCLLPSALLFVAYDLYVYASPLPNYADHSGTGHPAEIFAAFFGIFLDQQWGLLNHAPIYLLALAALVYWILKIRYAPSSSIQYPISNLKWLALIALPYFLLVVQYRYWWGEWCPPARYLMPILPLLVGPLTSALMQMIHSVRFRAIFITSTALGWGVALAFALDGRLMYNHPLGQSALLVALGSALHVDLTRFEPSFIMMFLKDIDPLAWIATQTILTIGWLIALSLIAWSALGADFSGLKNRLTLTSKFSIMRPTSPQKE